MTLTTVVELEAAHVAAVTAMLTRSLAHDTLTERLPAILASGNPARQALVVLAPMVSAVAYCSRKRPARGLNNPTGVIDLIAVDPVHQQRGLGSRLLGEVEHLLRTAGCDRVVVAGHPPHYAWPGVDARYMPALCLFNRAGYRRTGVEFTLAVDLPGNPHLEEPLAARKTTTVRLQRARDEDLGWILDGMSEDWPDTWPAEVTAALLGQQGGVIVAGDNAHGLLGFCAWGVNRDDEVGPLGVLPSQRGHGLGSALIREAMRQVRSDGFTVGVLPWVGPLAFFSRVLGAQPARTFVTLSKDL